MKSRVKSSDQMDTPLIKADQSALAQASKRPGQSQKSRKSMKKKVPMRNNSNSKNQEVMEAASAVVSNRQKSRRERQEIQRALKKHFLFKNLQDSYLEVIIDESLSYSIEQNQSVCVQGEPGSNFYIVDSGRLEIQVNNKTRGYLSKGDTFGELALMYDSNRTATIKTVEASSLWAIPRDRMRNCLLYTSPSPRDS